MNHESIAQKSSAAIGARATFSFLLRPIFAANHRWTLARGEESLKLELARRRAPNTEEAARIAPPPGPCFPYNLRRRKSGQA